jgi:hypothetical protein
VVGGGGVSDSWVSDSWVSDRWCYCNGLCYTAVSLDPFKENAFEKGVLTLYIDAAGSWLLATVFEFCNLLNVSVPRNGHRHVAT